MIFLDLQNRKENESDDEAGSLPFCSAVGVSAQILILILMITQFCKRTALLSATDCGRVNAEPTIACTEEK